MYSVNGGAHHPNMSYFWGYSIGGYTVEVWDAHNCGAQDLITITEPSELDVTITTSDLIMYGEDGEIEYGGSTESKFKAIFKPEFIKRVYLENNSERLDYIHRLKWQIQYFVTNLA